MRKWLAVINEVPIGDLITDDQITNHMLEDV